MSKEKNCNLNRINILILPQTVYWLGSLCLLTMSGWMVCPPARNLASPCLPLSPHMCACVDGAPAFPRSCLPLSPLSPTVSPHVSLCWMVGQPSEGLVSPCLQLSWMVCPPSRGLVSPCLPLSLIVCLFLSPIVTPHVCPLDAVSAFPRSCLPLSPIVSTHVCLSWMVRRPSRGLVSACLPLSPIVSHCLPTCVPVLAGASAFPTSCLPLRWLMRPPSRGLVCPCLLVFPHVCLRWMLCPPSRGLASACLPS